MYAYTNSDTNNISDNTVKNFLKLLKRDEIGEPPWERNFRRVMPPDSILGARTRSNKKSAETHKGVNGIMDTFGSGSKDFNEENSGYGVTDLMRDCTDKVKVRDYVKEKIGEEYLKPVLQIIPNESHETVHCHCEQVNDNSGLARQSKDICQNTPDCHDTQNEVVSRLRFPKFQFRENWVLAEYNDGEPNAVSAYFNQIDFDKLPNSFVIKTNHGCKWQYIIKSKNKFLSNKRLFDMVKRNITGWLEQDYGFWGGFEMQYLGISPKILIEPLMRNDINKDSDEIQVFCFNNKPYFTIRLYNNKKISIYDKNLKLTEDIFNFEEDKLEINPDYLINKAFVLSKKLIKNTDLYCVRVDWLIYKNKLYFGELTFTPYSGFWHFQSRENNYSLGKLINLEGELK